MRKNTKECLSSFVAGVHHHSERDTITVVTDGSAWYLHGNKIATKCGSFITLSSCGWETNTTKERLNAILTYYRMGYIFQQNFQWYHTQGKWTGSLSFDTENTEKKVVFGE